MGERLEPLFETIYGRSAAVRSRAEGARATVENFVGRLDAWSTRILSESRGALRALEVQESTESALAARSAAASEHLVRDLKEVLVSLQCHDATRQALEHVVEDLEAVQTEPSSAEGEASSAGFAEMYDVCRLAAAQVGEARQRLAAAIERIVASLRGVSGRAAELGDGLARLDGADAASSPMDLVKQRVQESLRALHEQLEQETATSAATAAVATAVDDIARDMQAVQEIGRQVKIIALNALVQTARAGAEGKVLAVMAQWTERLATDVGEKTKALARELTEAARAAQTLDEGEAARLAPEGTSIACELESLLARLQEHHSLLGNAARSVRGGSLALAEQVGQVEGPLLKLLHATEALAGVENELSNLAVETQDRTGATYYRAGQRLSTLARYTMQSERDVHQRVLAAAATPAGPPVPSGELGNNVELF